MRPRVSGKKRVVIVGAGFGGLSAAKRLAGFREIETLLVNRNNYHTFLPLLYQVAAAELDPEDIANPLRGLFRKSPNVSLALAEVLDVDMENRVLHTDGPDIDYDYLVLATGSETNFFGTPGAEENAFTLKSLEDAVRLRNHILQSFEQIALAPEKIEASKQSGLLHILLVGGGPSGVEYAGALSELIHTPLRRDFPELPPDIAQVSLLEGADEILAGFPDRLRKYVHNRLVRMGISVHVQARVMEVRKDAVLLGDGTVIPCSTVVWTAGARANELVKKTNIPAGRAGRAEVMSTLQVASHPEVFVIGDLGLPEGENAPMVAPNAMQQGRLAADNIRKHLRGETLAPFVYRDKGSLAVIGRSAAVAHIGRFTFSGFIAWILWLAVHLSYLIGFHSRVMVTINWGWDYFFAERSVRLILPRKSALRDMCNALFKKKEE